MQFLSKRIPTLLAIVLLLAVVGVGAWYLRLNKPKITEGERPKGVKITNVSDNKFSVSWTTSEASVGMVEWGVVGEKLTKKALDDRDTGGQAQKYQTHHVTVVDLQPETQYAFRIVAGTTGQVKLDNNGSPYTTRTAKSIQVTPAASSLYGQVESETGQPVGGALVYVLVPGGEPASALTKGSGSYSVSLSTIRSGDLTRYIEYDPKATIVTLSLEDGKREASATVKTANASPVPTIVMGKTQSFVEQPPEVAEVKEQDNEGVTAERPTIFNVEPLGDVPQTGGQVVLLNPTQDGEEVATSKPEFFGIGPSNMVLSITVHSTAPTSGTVVVDQNGEWAWTPPTNLEPGEHTLTIAYVDLAGIEQTLTRTFMVQPALAQEPAFEATPSASTTPTPTPTASSTPTPRPSSTTGYESSSSASPVASPREGMPSTESGVPVTGVITTTVLTAVAGFAIMVVGALLLAL